MLLLIVLIGMERVFLSTSKVKINDKTYVVPQYNLQGFEKYLLPSLDFKGTQHVYFHPNDINMTDLPSTRIEGQHWIFYPFTSPTNMPPLHKDIKVRRRFRRFALFPLFISSIP